MPDGLSLDRSPVVVAHVPEPAEGQSGVRVAEAELLAALIKRAVTEERWQVRDRSERRVRDAEYRDVAVIVPTRTEHALSLAVAALVVAQAVVVGLQVVGRHLHQPIPWTEEVARLLLGWLMCVGGILALRHAQHPRVTAVVRLLSPVHRAAHWK